MISWWSSWSSSLDTTTTSTPGGGGWFRRGPGTVFDRFAFAFRSLERAFGRIFGRISFVFWVEGAVEVADLCCEFEEAVTATGPRRAGEFGADWGFRCLYGGP